MDTSCPGSWLGVHKYRARYDEVEIPGALERLVKAQKEYPYNAFTRADYLTKRYVQDVCSRCGDVIGRLDTEMESDSTGGISGGNDPTADRGR